MSLGTCTTPNPDRPASRSRPGSVRTQIANGSKKSLSRCPRTGLAGMDGLHQAPRVRGQKGASNDAPAPPRTKGASFFHLEERKKKRFECLPVPSPPARAPWPVSAGRHLDPVCVGRRARACPGRLAVRRGGRRVGGWAVAWVIELASRPPILPRYSPAERLHLHSESRRGTRTAPSPPPHQSSVQIRRRPWPSVVVRVPDGRASQPGLPWGGEGV